MSPKRKFLMRRIEETLAAQTGAQASTTEASPAQGTPESAAVAVQEPAPAPEQTPAEETSPASRHTPREESAHLSG